MQQILCLWRRQYQVTKWEGIILYFPHAVVMLSLIFLKGKKQQTGTHRLYLEWLAYLGSSRVVICRYHANEPSFLVVLTSFLFSPGWFFPVLFIYGQWIVNLIIFYTSVCFKGWTENLGYYRRHYCFFPSENMSQCFTYAGKQIQIFSRVMLS